MGIGLRAHTIGLVLLLASCNSPSPAHTPPTIAKPTPTKAIVDPPAPPSKPADTGLTGALSEQEFKALHELKGEAAPAPRGQMIELAGTQAYLSLPPSKPGNDATPGIVVVHEWWGLNEHIKHWADRLAADGYAALAVDLYGGQVATESDSAMALMKSVDDQHAVEVLTAAHAFLANDPRVKAKKRGIIGWCFGGGWSLKHAIATSDLDAAVIYYGRLITDPKVLGPIQAELLGVFANQDQGIRPDAVNEFKNSLEKAGKSIELHQYDANHAFANPSSGRYDQPAATDAWDHVHRFFERTLKG